MNTQTTKTTKSRASSFSFNSIALFIVGAMAAIMIAFYFMAEVDDPEYLIYFAPILGLLFYGSYYVINQKIDPQFLNRTYPHEPLDS